MSRKVEETKIRTWRKFLFDKSRALSYTLFCFKVFHYHPIMSNKGISNLLLMALLDPLLRAQKAKQLLNPKQRLRQQIPFPSQLSAPPFPVPVFQKEIPQIAETIRIPGPPSPTRLGFSVRVFRLEPNPHARAIRAQAHVGDGYYAARRGIIANDPYFNSFFYAISPMLNVDCSRQPCLRPMGIRHFPVAYPL